MSTPSSSFHFPSHRQQSRVEGRLQIWAADGFNSRLWRRDPGLWGPEHTTEAAKRLGWLDLPEGIEEALESWAPLRMAARSSGVDELLVIGMGGSSLGAEMLGNVYSSETAARIRVLDSTHPRAVQGVADSFSPRGWLVVATKSGTTLETRCLADFFVERLRETGRDSREALITVTDPGSPLERWAAETGARAVVTAPPDVGGRFSALSAYGLLASVLAGADLTPMLADVRATRSNWRAAGAAAGNPGLRLGALLGELAAAGKNKLYLVLSGEQRAFGAWLEQLIAESLGKAGRGIIPVPCERLPGSEELADAQVVSFGGADVPEDVPVPWSVLPAPRPENVGTEILRWEIAIAAAAGILNVPPFDQPDVQWSKDWTRRLMTAHDPSADSSGRSISDAVINEEKELLARLSGLADLDYLAIQAYLAPSPEMDRRLKQLASGLGRLLRRPVTTAYGPRYLHSTGQLHKGGPARVVCLQLTDESGEDLPVPGRDFTFRRLVDAQADGDLRALADRGRHGLRFHLGPNPDPAFDALQESLGGAR